MPREGTEGAKLKYQDQFECCYLRFPVIQTVFNKDVSYLWWGWKFEKTLESGTKSPGFSSKFFCHWKIYQASSNVRRLSKCNFSFLEVSVMCQCDQSELVVIIPSPVSSQMEHVPRWRRWSLMFIKLLQETSPFPIIIAYLLAQMVSWDSSSLRMSNPPSDLHPASLNPGQDICLAPWQSTLVSPVRDPQSQRQQELA